MFFLLTKRAIRVARDIAGNTDQYAARSQTLVSYTVNGPFSKRSLAERGSINALRNVSCLEARVLTPDDIETLMKVCSSSSFDNGLYNALIHIKKVYLTPKTV